MSYRYLFLGESTHSLAPSVPRCSLALLRQCWNPNPATIATGVLSRIADSRRGSRRATSNQALGIPLGCLEVYQVAGKYLLHRRRLSNVRLLSRTFLPSTSILLAELSPNRKPEKVYPVVGGLHPALMSSSEIRHEPRWRIEKMKYQLAMLRGSSSGQQHQRDSQQSGLFSSFPTYA